MTKIAFEKFQGFGNDYIVIERSQIPESVDIAGLAMEICDRNTGVGSDGISIIEPHQDYADFACEIVNPDGSIAGFSGNGTRCAVAYLYRSGAWSGELLSLQTRSGVKKYRLLERHGSGEFWFEAEIGQPHFASDRIPVAIGAHEQAVVNQPIELGGRSHEFSAVNVGNPVACIFVETFDFDWRSTGREMERHPIFPDRTNAVFVKVLNEDAIELRIWERGAGETAASGTCSAGAAVLSALLLKTHRRVDVHSPGGTTRVNWREDGEMVLDGRADFVFAGEWTVEA